MQTSMYSKTACTLSFFGRKFKILLKASDKSCLQKESVTGVWREVVLRKSLEVVTVRLGEDVLWSSISKHTVDVLKSLPNW